MLEQKTSWSLGRLQWPLPMLSPSAASHRGSCQQQAHTAAAKCQYHGAAKAFSLWKSPHLSHMDGYSNAERTRTHPEGTEPKCPFFHALRCLPVPLISPHPFTSSHKTFHSPPLHPLLLASLCQEKQLRASPPHLKHQAFFQQVFTSPLASQLSAETTSPKSWWNS